MDSSTSSSGLRVALLIIGGSAEVRRAIASLSLMVFWLSLLVVHAAGLVAKEIDTQCFSKGID